MSSKSPVFLMPEPQHFSDYGFDPQIDYFQVLEEAKKHKRGTARSIDTLHFKLQKPISKDDHSKKKRRWWWKNALLFFKSKWTHLSHYNNHHRQNTTTKSAETFRGSISGPIYITESTSGSSSPYRTTNRPTSGPLAGTITPARKGDPEIPYFSLRELNMDQSHRISASPMPIYLVT